MNGLPLSKRGCHVASRPAVARAAYSPVRHSCRSSRDGQALRAQRRRPGPCAGKATTGACALSSAPRSRFGIGVASVPCRSAPKLAWAGAGAGEEKARVSAVFGAVVVAGLCRRPPKLKMCVLAQFPGRSARRYRRNRSAGVARNGGFLADEVLINPGLGQVDTVVFGGSLWGEVDRQVAAGFLTPAGLEKWPPLQGGPRVRIRLPPPASPSDEPLSGKSRKRCPSDGGTEGSNPSPSSRESVSLPHPLSKVANPGFPRGCARLAWRAGRQRRAEHFDIAPTGGNISVAPYSSTAVPLMWWRECHAGANEVGASPGSTWVGL